jgi:hypothetical protein
MGLRRFSKVFAWPLEVITQSQKKFGKFMRIHIHKMRLKQPFLLRPSSAKKAVIINSSCRRGKTTFAWYIKQLKSLCGANFGRKTRLHREQRKK